MRLYVTGTVVDHVARRSVGHAVPVPPAPPVKRKLRFTDDSDSHSLLNINRHAESVSLASRAYVDQHRREWCAGTF